MPDLQPPDVRDAAELEPARLVLHTYQSVDAWAWACAVSIAAELRRDLLHRPRARLLLSGGSTPAPAYGALSRAPLEWERIDVALVDERWLLPDDPDSNAHLVRTHLLKNNASAARFEPITCSGRSIEEAVAVANAHGRQPTAVAVLGMGQDGHVASLFPGMHGLDRAVASTEAYVAVDAATCAGAGQWQRRISLTPAGLYRAQLRLLLIRGGEKRALLERAIATGDARRWPVLLTMQRSMAIPLQVHWCP